MKLTVKLAQECRTLNYFMRPLFQRFMVILLTLTSIQISSAQTNATDFTADDCASVSHQLFAELNDGKVVVICWVMPCGNCIAPALTVSTALQQYESSHPGKVKYYMADDYGNTSCGTLNTWASTNGISPHAIFSTNKVSMSAYGADGMPKTVVLGGYNHEVFLNKNGSLTETALKTAIDNALVTAASGDPAHHISGLTVYPNPASGNTVTLAAHLAQSGDVRIRITGITGQLIKDLTIAAAAAGDFETTINTAEVPQGTYEVLLQTSQSCRTTRLIIE